VNLHEGFYLEKYFGKGIQFDQLHSDILTLAYAKDIDFSLSEQRLSENGKLKIRQMAEELAARYKTERKSKVRLNIYGVNPNYHYQLIHGIRYSNILGFELITDGDILEINPQTMKGFEYYYTSPINPNEAVQLENNKVVYVSLENATYAIMQGVCDGKIRYCNVNTQILDEKRLKKISNLANKKYEKDEYALTDEEPYVRKLVLK